MAENIILEQLADLEHKQWAVLTDHILDKIDRQARDREEIERWEKQIKTAYEELDEDEKDKDREWAEKVLDKMLLIVDKEGNAWINNGKPITKKQLKQLIKAVGKLLDEGGEK